MIQKFEDKSLVNLQKERTGLRSAWADANSPIKRARRKLHDIINKCDDVDAMNEAIAYLAQRTKLS